MQRTWTTTLLILGKTTTLIKGMMKRGLAVRKIGSAPSRMMMQKRSTLARESGHLRGFWRKYREISQRSKCNSSLLLLGIKLLLNHRSNTPSAIRKSPSKKALLMMVSISKEILKSTQWPATILIGEIIKTKASIRPKTFSRYPQRETKESLLWPSITISGGGNRLYQPICILLQSLALVSSIRIRLLTQSKEPQWDSTWQSPSQASSIKAMKRSKRLTSNNSEGKSLADLL